MSLYLPAPRVSLEKWCEWTGQNWSKVRSVVGHGFRVPAPDENAYTMAATAVLRLIRQYDIDVERIGYLALGTETSTDNSAGAVIVRGMVDQGLAASGMPRLSRHCEVPEFKHACLGGVYALKAATRYLESDGCDKLAIVVCSDIAEYERGSSGEQTQGAGAVAMLCSADAALLSFHLAQTGSASHYRGPDFRKPQLRYRQGQLLAHEGRRPRDFPVFSGKYSTHAYVDETLQAFEGMVRRRTCTQMQALADAKHLFFHRPYQHMPIQAASYLLLSALLTEPTSSSLLESVCAMSGTNAAALRDELMARPDLFARVLKGDIDSDPLPGLNLAAGSLRKSAEFGDFVAEKMRLGSGYTAGFGNLYTAALPAWIAAGMQEAYDQDVDIAGARVLVMGYGSGDAAECMPGTVAPGFRQAAERIGLDESLQGAVDLTREQYESLHDVGTADGLPSLPGDRFRITHVGKRNDSAFQDIGVEYFEYIP